MTGEEMRALRLRLGYTQHELAAALGTRQTTVSAWETGRAPIAAHWDGRVSRLPPRRAPITGRTPEEQRVYDCVRRQECPICGRKGLRSLGSHVRGAHGIMSDEIREMAAMTREEPLCSPEYSAMLAERRSDHLRAIAHDGARASAMVQQRELGRGGQLARARANAARSKPMRTEWDCTCTVCGQSFQGPYRRSTCSPLCLMRARLSASRQVRSGTWDLLLDAMTGRYTGRELAERHGKTIRAVEKTLSKWGVRLSLARPIKARSDSSPDRDAMMVARFLDGESMTEIGGALGVTRERVRQVLEVHGLTGESRLHTDTARRPAIRREALLEEQKRRTRYRLQKLREVEGARLRMAREQAGLSQTGLGELLGVEQATVSRWELGKWKLTTAAREWLAANGQRGG